MAICKACKAKILWAEIAATKKLMPVDNKYVNIVTDDGRLERGMQTHYTSCPFAAQFRKKKSQCQNG